MIKKIWLATAFIIVALSSAFAQVDSVRYADSLHAEHPDNMLITVKWHRVNGRQQQADSIANKSIDMLTNFSSQIKKSSEKFNNYVQVIKLLLEKDTASLVLYSWENLCLFGISDSAGYRELVNLKKLRKEYPCLTAYERSVYAATVDTSFFEKMDANFAKLSGQPVSGNNWAELYKKIYLSDNSFRKNLKILRRFEQGKIGEEDLFVQIR